MEIGKNAIHLNVKTVNKQRMMALRNKRPQWKPGELQSNVDQRKEASGQ